MCIVVFGDRINIDRCEVWFWVEKKGLLIRCGIPTRRKAKSVTQIRDKKIPSRLEMLWGVQSGPRWDQRSLKCLGGVN